MAATIDADVHVAIPKLQALYPYLAANWVEHFEQSLDNGAVIRYHPTRASMSRRPSRENGGEPVGTGLDDLRSESLDPDAVEVAISSCLYAVDSIHNPDVAAALSAAVNEWQAEEWLAKEPRLRGSVVVPIQIPTLAIAEIERMAEREGFVQVLIPVRTEHPLGSRLYHPLWEAIESSGLVAGVHFGGAPVQPPTPTGWPSTYLEQYVAMAQVFATQLTSMIVEGVFDAYPKLRVAFLESGFTWLPAHLWRMDKEWRNLRRLVPWVRRPPSDYVREHVRFGIQPLDSPPTIEQLLEVVDQLESEDLLLYTSDFPHRHASDVEADLLAHLPEGLQRKIRGENARELYGV
ncbi:MAG: amidohydrolase family protein [Acidobacteriota bacterium]|nr:amidohydrolase family protein [Acidobacteriota bacterium]